MKDLNEQFIEYLHNWKPKKVRNISGRKNIPITHDWETICNIFDEWQFYTLYGLGGMPVNEEHSYLYEFLNRSIEPEKFLDAVDKLGIVEFDDSTYIDRKLIMLLIPMMGNNKTNELDEYIEMDLAAIAQSYGYRERIRYRDKSDHNYLVIEFIANYTKNVTDEIYDLKDTKNSRYAGILYHICPKDIYEQKILKTGLIPKSKCKFGRFYEPRIYLYRAVFEPNKKKILTAYAEDLAKSENYRHKEWIVLEINLNKNRDKLSFYEDSEYPIQGTACFTYDVIHPRCITKLFDLKF